MGIFAEKKSAPCEAYHSSREHRNASGVPSFRATNRIRGLLRILNTTETNPAGAIQARRRQQEFAMLAELIGLREIPY